MAECSILIPTYGRNNFLLRLLQHLVDSKCEFPVVVADSSEDADAEIKRNFVHQYSDKINVYYIRYPSSMMFWEKTYRSVCTVSTKYIRISADDDLPNLGLIRKALNYMEGHADCAAVIGSSASFSLFGGNAFGDVDRIHVFRPCTDYPQSDAIQRLKGLGRDYSPLFYALRTTESVVDSMGKVVSEGWIVRYSETFSEVFDAACVVARGYVKYIDEFDIARQAIASSDGVKNQKDQVAMIIDPRFFPMIDTGAAHVANLIPDGNILREEVRYAFGLYYAAALNSPQAVRPLSTKVARALGVPMPLERAIKKWLYARDLRKLPEADRMVFSDMMKCCQQIPQ